MRCRGARKRLTEYLDGGLSEEERLDVGKHIGSCPECTALLKRIEQSSDALSQLEPELLSETASEKILHNLRHEFAIHEPAGKLSMFFSSGRAIAIAGTTAVVLAAVVIAGGIAFNAVSSRYKDSGQEIQTLESKTAVDSAEGQPGKILKTGSDYSPDEDRSISEEQALTQKPMPQVQITANDYTDLTFKDVIENLDLRKQISESYGMSEAVNLKKEFTSILMDEFMKQNENGELLGNMIEYVGADQVALLPYYVEKAFFTGRQAIIICLAGPVRTGDSGKLSRTEIWVLDPELFTSNPDGSLINFMQYQYEE
ncbi:MAG: zf-HC2 domain-containing protein [Actinobacteria bacterium]|nr:zf-HC2 domain-containing protein [Actinomycetota bacterium]